MLKTAISAAALSLAVVATPVMAGSDEKPTMTVETRDLDLSTVEGQERLDRRIDQAAKKICETNAVRTGTRLKSASRSSCYKNAVKSVEKQVATMIRDQQRGG